MAYDDDDLFGEDFDFVDEDEIDASDSDEDSELDEEKPKKKTAKRSPRSKSAAKPAKKAPATRSRKKVPAKPVKAAPVEDEEPEPPLFDADEIEDVDETEEVKAAGALVDAADDPLAADDDSSPLEADVPSEAADHLVHIYQHGVLSRTIPRKFTDEDAVNFAVEYSRTGKSYGRRAVAMPQDETPAQMFDNAAKGG